ncbi:MAG: CusA/CzcA family heavy metal efflux RND transporter [Candidatus Cloacimonadota bacterium]|nr:MAG: CusA/CzcA family heavy metal efflux RND transporter [Candidatus Cloacimonadota bacterium]
MLNYIISWSLNNRITVLLMAIIICLFGVYSINKLPIDAFPDITPVQIQINTTAPTLNPSEIEQQVTFQIERAISGLPSLSNVRSISKFGFSQVIVTFDEGTDIYFARQVIFEKIQQVSMPSGISPPSLGPVSTGLGEIFHYSLEGENQSLTELTTIQNWIIKPQLESTPGVAEINTWGGKKKEYQIIVNLSSLAKYNISIDEVILALKDNNLNVGGAGISQRGEYHLVHGIAIKSSVSELENISVGFKNNVSILVKDIAKIDIGYEIRRGAITVNSKGESILGLGFMLKGQNSNEVTKRLATKVKKIQKYLPEGVKIKILYQRTDLIASVISTVKENLLLGALLVISILFCFLGNLRAGLIVALAIPFSMLFAAIEMLQFGIAGSLMSLGAIDFGLIVDSSVIIVENSLRKIQEAADDANITQIVKEASIEVRKPTMFGELIILIVFIPILGLEGIEGKLFIPMALTMIFALLGSLVMSLTLTPVLVSFFLKKQSNHKEVFLMRFLKSIYHSILKIVIKQKYSFVTLGLVLMFSGVFLASRLGHEFVPKLSEMGIVINTIRLAGVSLDESVRYGSKIEEFLIKKFPNEIKDIWTRTGTAETATDPMGIELSDVFITLKQKEKWTKVTSQSQLVKLMREELKVFPGMRMVFTQPIEMRVNEMVAGIRSDLGIKVFGDDLEILKSKANEVKKILEKIEGSSDIYVEQITGQPILELKVKQDMLNQYGISARMVLQTIEAIGPIQVGEIRENQKRFNLIIRLEDQYKSQIESIDSLMIYTKDNKQIPLSKLVTITQKEGPSTISREWQKRRIIVQSNVNNRDLGAYVKDVQIAIDKKLSLDDGYFLSYGGQYENLQRAQTRLLIIIPITLILILFVLFISTNSVIDTAIIFTGAPFAALGGIIMLTLREMPFTIAAGVGFVAVCGVAMLNGLIMMSTIRQELSNGANINEAVERGALLRLRPVLMTALVAGIGFIPMAFNTGIGAEIQRPLATVVLGGVIADNLLTLLLLPALVVTFIKVK